MKVIKLVFGILSVEIAILLVFQLVATSWRGIFGSSYDNSVMIFVAMLLGAGGMVDMMTVKNLSRGGSCAAMILFILVILISAAAANGSFADLPFYIAWGVIAGIVILSQ